MKKWILAVFLVSVALIGGCGPKPPEAPTGLTAAGNVNGIYLSWTESYSEDVTVYNIYRSENGTDFVKIGEVPFGNHQFTDGAAITSPAQTGVLYYYQVKAFGKVESAPSNAVRNVRGPRMTNQSAPLNIANGQTMVVEGTVSVPGGISVESGGKLFLMGGSKLQFSNYGNPVELYVAGLLRIVASADNPAVLQGYSPHGFSIRLNGAENYNPDTGSGTLLEFAQLTNMGNSGHGVICIENCTPMLRNLKAASVNGAGREYFIAARSGATIEHCLFEHIYLNISGDLRAAPLAIRHNVFTKSVSYAMSFNFTTDGPNIATDQISGNSFEVDGISDATPDIYLYSVKGTGTFMLNNNYWHDTTGTKLAPSILKNACDETIVFNDFTQSLESAPVGAGPQW